MTAACLAKNTKKTWSLFKLNTADYVSTFQHYNLEIPKEIDSFPPIIPTRALRNIFTLSGIFHFLVHLCLYAKGLWDKEQAYSVKCR